MKLVDSHTHLFDMKKDYLLPEDIYPVVVGYSHSSNKKAVEVAKKNRYPFVLGIAPQTAIRNGVAKLDDEIDFIRTSRPNAIGEVGLDYKWAETKKQIEDEHVVFAKMINLADELGLPLVIHSRNKPNKTNKNEDDTADENDIPNDSVNDAIEEIITMTAGMRILMHFYSGSEEQAQRIIKRGGYISVTSMRSKERRKVINRVPLDRLLVESDSPYIGRTPESIREAVTYIAEVKEVDKGVVAKATSENAMKFFGFRL